MSQGQRRSRRRWFSRGHEAGLTEDAPLRAELFSITQLGRFARARAKWQRVSTTRGSRADRLLARLDQNASVLLDAHGSLSDASALGHRITPAAEWFIDNYHLIEEQIRLARRHLPRGFARELPHLVNGSAIGMPRVYDLALNLISHTHGHVDSAALCAFVNSYQSVQLLVLGELWAIPIMLRLALIENLRRVVDAVSAGRRDRARAALWADELLAVAATGPARVVSILADMVKDDPPLSDSFVAELASRLHDQGPALSLPTSWLELRLAERGKTIEHAYLLTNQSQAADQVSIRNSIGSLRFLGSSDWREFVESMSVVERILRSEPTGTYATMDFATRDDYRHAVEALARRSTRSQEEIAHDALELAASVPTGRAAHIGYFLVDAGRSVLERLVSVRERPGEWVVRRARRVRLALYVGSSLAITCILTALAANPHLALGPPDELDALTLSFWGLFVFCSLHVAIGIVQWLATMLVKPCILPRLDFATGIPTEHRTAVVVPTLLTDVGTIDGLLEHLELHFLSNRDPQLQFGLLTDFGDAPHETMTGDGELLQHVRTAIEILNERYRELDPSEPFFLCHRPRRWNPCEGVWMGWERKRGKLEDFNALLRGEVGRFELTSGGVDRLRGTAYVIVLDSDTELPRDAARQLVGTMAHPLNRPVWNDAETLVSAGYSVLQPRVTTSLPSTNLSRYARLFAGEPGTDPYTRAVSDVYQDVFREGSFIGKGIYDVDAMRRACAKRFPENRILSHDLLEGAHGRSGVVSDVILYDNHPAVHAADVIRRARWIRGDWQIARWILARVPGEQGGRIANPISALSKLKIVDNLRRSLVPIALLAMLVVGGSFPVVAPLALGTVLATLYLPSLLAAFCALARFSPDVPGYQRVKEVARSLGRSFQRETFALACVPFDAAISSSAIARTLCRLHFTRRYLLEWHTAADAARSKRTGLAGTYASMWILPLAAIASAMLLLLQRSPVILLAVPILALWLLAPALAWWLSEPILAQRPRLAPTDITFLRRLARRTWRFFEVTVTEEDHDLPPDNLQVDPDLGLAHRTSPTNVGCALAANLAAYDLGYSTAGELIARTSRTLATLDRLPRYHGHFYNWYDTRTLEPLPPRYVSTVDSGNLTAMLLTLGTGLGELVTDPVHREELYAGMQDTLEVLLELAAPPPDVSRVLEALQTVPKTPADAQIALSRLTHATGDLVSRIEARGDLNLTSWAQALDGQVRRAHAELRQLIPWVDLAPPPDALSVDELGPLLGRFPTLLDLTRIESIAVPAIDRTLAAGVALGAPSLRESEAWLETLRVSVARAGETARERLHELRRLAACCQQLGEHDVAFLYDRGRHLLSIGYSVTDHHLDAGFYDLLASEARLASYVAIAKNKLPQEHWFHLGRQLTTSRGLPVLLSWSGSMFEYLMPLLLMPNFRGTMLDATYRAVVEHQVDYGRTHSIPWGFSESGYNTLNADKNYQYRAFGVPGLGFKRGLADDLVVAPYASVMALMVAPGVACANLRRLANDGFLGQYGFYEAIDYTPSRLPPGKDSVAIQSYMAHHEGMSLLALVHLLADRPMQRRFSADPFLRATELLLQERVPRTPRIRPSRSETLGARITGDVIPDVSVFSSTDTPAPEVALLSNGTYHVAVSHTGGGYSRWRDLAVTRWHEDPTRDCWGSFCYIRDVTTGSFWSVAHQPTLRPADQYEALFSPGRVEVRRSDENLEVHVEICVSPEDDVEVRRIRVSNMGQVPRTIELTSYAEVVLAPPDADAAHPAFSNLFVQTEIVRKHQAILCTRRPRSTDENPPFMIHLMTVHAQTSRPTSFETDRGRFMGRCRTLVDPEAMHHELLGDSEGAVLDPIVAIRNTIELACDETVQIHLATGVSPTRDGALEMIEKYTDRHLPYRVFELSGTLSQVMHRHLDVTRAETRLYDQLAGHVLYSNSILRASKSVIADNRQGQSHLWAYGISGDLPIVLVRIRDPQRIAIVRDMARAHAYWRLRGFTVDLIVWNEDASVYRQELQDAIVATLATVADGNLIDRPGGIFVRRSDQMSEEDGILLQAVARVSVRDDGGSLAEQLDRRVHTETRSPMRLLPILEADAPTLVDHQSPAMSSRPLERPELVSWNGLGGFTRDGKEYIVVTNSERRTPAPWSNVLANPVFGTVVSESGGSYTWCENAHSYRLTPWYNDAIGDASGEALYVRDDEDGSFWSPTPSPAPGPNSYTTRHGFGYSVFEATAHGIATELTIFVTIDEPVKFMVLKIRNESGRPRRLSVTAFFELVLGSQRGRTMPHLVTELDLMTGALFARNAFGEEFAQRVAFLDCSEANRTFTGDRREFLGRNGDRGDPRSMKHDALAGQVGAGLDPCFAIQATFDSTDGEEHEIAFVLGSGRDLDDARRLVYRFRGTGPANGALEKTRSHWEHVVGAVQVRTEEPSLDVLANGWLIYQVVACRLWGRSGYYQSGGAYGFRDQLQDVAALVHAEPALLREHILRAASRQFPEGDVQHWWHPPLGRGVRTRISDDFLWLPMIVCRYVSAHGDAGILDEPVGFIGGRAVDADEDSYYDLPIGSDLSTSLYDHCVRAILHGLRFGSHGLPLMGTGDWNDGMNLVGAAGRGESVWLGFFLYDVLQSFAELARGRTDEAFAETCTTEAARLRANLEEHGWDGDWYRRAYFDDGLPLGTKGSSECAIDSLPQSWAILSGAGDPERTARGLDAVYARLVDHELGVIRLFDPPFDSGGLDPGYVRGYVPGVRENGGQYTHAAIWAVMAFAESGDADRAWELFRLINPVNHGGDGASIERYMVEPYVVAADVYTNHQHPGRGGWTWYTGSAGWMYRLILESLLGIRLEIDRLRVEPRIPSTWSGFEVDYRWRETVHHIRVVNLGGAQGIVRVLADGIECPEKTLPLRADRQEHWYEVTIG